MTKSKKETHDLSPAQWGKIRLRAALTSTFVGMTGVGAADPEKTVKQFENWVDKQIARYERKNAFIKAVNKFLEPLDLYICEKGDEKTPQEELEEMWENSGTAIRGNYPRVRIDEGGMLLLTDVRNAGGLLIGRDADGFLHPCKPESLFRFDTGAQAFEIFKQCALPGMFKLWMKEHEERERLKRGEFSSTLIEKEVKSDGKKENK